MEEQRPWVDLRQQIILSPENDELRIAFANQWEQAGLDPERAWVIRIQVSLEMLPGGVDHPEWWRLAGEASELIHARGQEWTPNWFAECNITQPVFYRGFIGCVTASAATLLDSKIRDRLFASAPIQHLNIIDIEGDQHLRKIVDRLSQEGLSWRIQSLKIDGQNLTDEGMQHLAGSGLFNLRWLSVAYNRIGNAGVRALAEASFRTLPKLLYVNLEGNPTDPVEQPEEDQGVVVGVTVPKIQAHLPRAPWLKRDIVNGRAVEPGRFSKRSSGSNGTGTPATSAVAVAVI